MGKPTTDLELSWEDDLVFHCRAEEHDLVIDSDGGRGASPMQLLGAALAGCMSVDVVHILERMRTPPTSLRLALHGVRADSEPRRFVRLELTFVVDPEVPEANLARAIALSRDKYCSVMHSLRPDIEIEVRHEREG